MFSRVLYRLGLGLRQQLWVVAFMAGCAIAAVIYFTQPTTPRPTVAAPPDCADVLMHTMAGPDADATRAAWNCAGPNVQFQMGGTPDAAINTNSHFPTGGVVTRVGAHGPYVFYVVQRGSNSAWYVVTVAADGKVVSLD